MSKKNATFNLIVANIFLLFHTNHRTPKARNIDNMDTLYILGSLETKMTTQNIKQIANRKKSSDKWWVWPYYPFCIQNTIDHGTQEKKTTDHGTPRT